MASAEFRPSVRTFSCGLFLLLLLLAPAYAQRQMEKLGRGVVVLEGILIFDDPELLQFAVAGV